MSRSSVCGMRGNTGSTRALSTTLTRPAPGRQDDRDQHRGRRHRGARRLSAAGHEDDLLDLPPGGWKTAFAFGYALTVHKAQGSELASVLDFVYKRAYRAVSSMGSHQVISASYALEH